MYVGSIYVCLYTYSSFCLLKCLNILFAAHFNHICMYVAYAMLTLFSSLLALSYVARAFHQAIIAAAVYTSPLPPLSRVLVQTSL